jgi:hypothetical protein
MKWELAIIERFTVGLMIGFSYYPKEDEKDFTELNFFLIFFALHFKFY